MARTIARLSIEQENCAHGAEFVPVSNNNRRRHRRVVRHRVKPPKSVECSKDGAMYRVLVECYRFEDLLYQFCARHLGVSPDAEDDLVYQFYKSRFLEPLEAIHKEVADLLLCGMEDRAFDEAFTNKNEEDVL